MLASRCGVSAAMLPTVASLFCLHISQACSPAPALDPAPAPALDPVPAPALAEFVEHRAGNTNLVISAPHGGSLRPEALPMREAGCRGPGLARYTQLYQL